MLKTVAMPPLERAPSICYTTIFSAYQLAYYYPINSQQHTTRRAKKKSNPPIDTLASNGWHFCYTHPQATYGGDYESQEADIQDGVLAIGWFG